VAGTAVAPFPRPWEWALDAERAAELALAGLEELHRHELRSEDAACYLVEPVQGAGGCHPAGRRFLEGLPERADRHGALLVFDEVQTGLGRTGAWFGADTYEVAPDVICLGKALGGGLPLSAVGASPELLASLPAGGHGSTFGGSPLACAAALAALEVAALEDLPGRARRLGAAAKRRLRRLEACTPALVDVRGEGLMLGLEFGDPVSRRPCGALADAVARALEAEGVLALCSGPEGSVVRLIPPLVLSDEELHMALARSSARSQRSARPRWRPMHHWHSSPDGDRLGGGPLLNPPHILIGLEGAVRADGVRAAPPLRNARRRPTVGRRSLRGGRCWLVHPSGPSGWALKGS
jgi:4-aminobutyrate aminotransferase